MTTPTLDVFVYRRLVEGRFGHIGGFGRGEGWAGIVEVDLDAEPVLRRCIEDQEVVAVHAPEPQRVVGPYWATDAVLVPLSRDEFVVIGGAGCVVDDVAQCRTIARSASSAIEDVSPAKRIADELELLHAVRAVASLPLDARDVVADQLLRVATAALSCEIGVLHLPGDGVTAVVADDARVVPTQQEAAAWGQDVLAGMAGAQVCHQDVAAAHRPAAPGWGDDVLAMVAVPLALEVPGVLLLAHTVVRPRGFTRLCQQIAGEVGTTARTVLLACRAHEQLQRAAGPVGRATPAA